MLAMKVYYHAAATCIRKKLMKHKTSEEIQVKLRHLPSFAFRKGTIIIYTILM